MFSEFSEGVDRARVDTAIEFLDAVERSILEPVEDTKEMIRKVPTGELDPVTNEPIYRETREIIRYKRAPDIKGALWWLERTMPEFARKIEHEGKLQVDGIPPAARDVTIRMVRAWDDPEEDDPDEEATEPEGDQDAEV